MEGEQKDNYRISHNIGRFSTRHRVNLASHFCLAAGYHATLKPQYHDEYGSYANISMREGLGFAKCKMHAEQMEMRSDLLCVWILALGHNPPSIIPHPSRRRRLLL